MASCAVVPAGMSAVAIRTVTVCWDLCACCWTLPVYMMTTPAAITASTSAITMLRTLYVIRLPHLGRSGTQAWVLSAAGAATLRAVPRGADACARVEREEDVGRDKQRAG